MMEKSLLELIKQQSTADNKADQQKTDIEFSVMFFSDLRPEISNAEKYAFTRDISVWADQEGFAAIYLPERHFSEFGATYANSAVMASYLIAQTQRIRFRTAGVSLPLHHPAEVVEWWAMNDILSGGRVDLGFGSGWNRPDFIYAPDHYEDRREICLERIPQVQQLWRGETVEFPGVDGEMVPIQVFPRPLQPELNVWMLVAQNTEAFADAGRRGYNVFTMLYGYDLQALAEKIQAYRAGRKEGEHDPETGIVSLMLHTLVHEDRQSVDQAVKKPFKAYLKTSMNAHLKAGLGKESGTAEISVAEKEKMLEYAYQRYYKTGALFGSVDEAKAVVDEAIRAGVNDIACLLDFGVDYSMVKESLPYLKQLVSFYQQSDELSKVFS